jgi:hypothetical protein
MSKQKSYKILNQINIDYKLQKKSIQYILTKKEYLHIKDHLFAEYHELAIKIFKDKVIINISTSSGLNHENEL